MHLPGFGATLGLHHSGGTYAIRVAPARVRARRVSVRAGQSPATPVSPVPLTAEQDHKRIMDLLKISGFPPGAVATSPDTYNEALANPYPNLPDPLTLKNGRKVTTAAMWRTRRAEIVEDFEREIYGRRPSNLPKVSWQVVNTSSERNGDVATVTRQLLGRVDNPRTRPSASTFRPRSRFQSGARGRVPVIIQFGGGAFDLPATVSTSANPCQLPGPARGRGVAPAAAPQGGAAASQEPTWQQQILSRGWGYVNLNPGSVQGDCGAGLQAGIIGLVNKGQPRKLDDWGGLSAWGWGASRVLDYLETDSAVDPSRVGVQGHSRYGKAALLAMALDERFAIGYISSSGHGGAKLHRRKYGETVENLATRYLLLDGGQLPEVHRTVGRDAGRLARINRGVRTQACVHQCRKRSGTAQR